MLSRILIDGPAILFAVLAGGLGLVAFVGTMLYALKKGTPWLR